MNLRMRVPAPLGIAAVAALGVLSSHAWAADFNLSSFVDRIVTAYGGSLAVERSSVMRQHGRTISKMRGGVTGAVVRELGGPGRLRIEIAYPGATVETRILDRNRGWNRNRPVPAAMHAAMRLQAARLSLPHLLTARRGDLIDEGPLSVPTRPPLDLGHRAGSVDRR